MSIRFRGHPSWPRREVRAGSEARDGGDDQLMAQLAAGRHDALGPLYSRYAPRLYSLATQSLDRTSAEEIVQEVFLQVWRKAATYSPERGTFKAWVFQIAHHRILNELRRRSRRPQFHDDPDGLRLAAAPDPVPGPDEVVEAEAERAQVREALAALPEAQRRAVEMAFVEGLTHAEVADSLQVPLGTTKTRIRAGLRRLRAGLAPAVAALVIVAGIGAIIGIRNEQASRALDGRALALLTSSETVAIRLNAAPDVPPETHAVYRGHTGATIAVLNLEKCRPAPAGQTYRAWIRHGETWTSLGAIRPDAGGDARLIVEGPAVDRLPDAIEITLEPARGSPSPHGLVIVTGTPGPPATQYR